MLKHNKLILGIITLGICTSLVNFNATIKANASTTELSKLGAYDIESNSDITLPVKEAADENGVTWKYKELKDGTVYLVYAENVQANMEIPAQLNGKTVTVIGSIAEYKSLDHDSGPAPDGIIKSVKIPSTIKFIAPGAFHCSNLTDVKLPAATWVSKEAFDSNTPWFVNQRDSQGLIIINNRLIGVKDPVTDIVIPSNVTEIADLAFSSSNNINSITIPSSVKKIGSCAFLENDNLRKVKFSSSAIDIDSSAFNECNQLGTIEFPSKIPYDDFRHTAWFENQKNSQGFVIIDGVLVSAENQSGSITIPSNVTEIGEEAFAGQENVTSVNVPGNVKKISSNAFEGCYNLNSVTLNSGIKTIEKDAFKDCAFSKIAIPSSVTTMDDLAFKNGVTIEKNGTSYIFTRKDSEMQIENNVLINAGAQTEEFKIPDNVTAIGKGAFEGWTKLKKVEIPNSVKEIGEKAFSGCTNLENVTIPNSVTKIGNYAFEECTNFDKIEIPGSVQEIGEYAFVSCSALKDVTLNEGIKTISTGAFNLCKNLKVLKVPSSVTNTGQDTAFDSGVTIIKNGTSYVNKDPYNNAANTAGKAGTVQQGWHKDGEHWNWLWSNGTKLTGWNDENGQWYYFYGNGEMAIDFIDLGGYSYYFKPNSSDGKAPMATGWQYIDGKWFYFNPNSDGYKGLMKRACWSYINGVWYYFYYDGSMAHDTWIDGYYINSYGEWA